MVIAEKTIVIQAMGQLCMVLGPGIGMVIYACMNKVLPISWKSLRAWP